MGVAAIMSRPVVTVELDDPLSVVKKIFDNVQFHHLLVVEKGKLLGVISDRDLFKALSPNLGTAAEKPIDSATLNKRVHQIMSRNPVCIDQSEPVAKALDVFQNHPISCIPVLDHHQKPVGILSWRDIFKVVRIDNSAEPDDSVP